MNAKFFCGYRKTTLKPDEVLLNITIPFTRKVSRMRPLKSSPL